MLVGRDRRARRIGKDGPAVRPYRLSDGWYDFIGTLEASSIRKQIDS